MSRRVLAILALLLVAALLGGWLWRTRAPGLAELPRAVGESGSGPTPARSAEHESARAVAGADNASGFESLASVPGDLLLQCRDVATLAAVPGAEVFALEGTESGWPRWEQRSSGPPLDLEAELRSRGRKSASDEHGDVRLHGARLPLRVIARKGELFGAACVGIEDDRAAAVWMYPSTDCIVRVRDPDGRPVADAPIEIGSRATDELWRGGCDAAGECRVANLGWLLRRFGPDEGWAYATVEGSSAASAVHWLRVEEATPPRIELTLASAPRITLRLAASDGTALPIAGSLCARALALAGQDRSPSARRNAREIPIVRGTAALEGGQSGRWCECSFQLAGGVGFVRSLRLPERSEAPGEHLVRVPQGVQVLLAHPVDERDEPLANATFEWIVTARLESDGLEHEALHDLLTSDADGLLVFPVQLVPRADSPWTRPHGRLCRNDGARELECAPIQFSELGNAAVRDLGKLALRPAPTLARGRIVDDLGQPIPGVLVRLRLVPLVDGRPSPQAMSMEARPRATTDAEGRFQLSGELLDRLVVVEARLTGYSTPRDAPPLIIEPANQPDVSLTLVRDGAVRISMTLAQPLTHRFFWQLWFESGARAMLELGPKDGAGLIERDIRNVPPGTYRARFVDGESGAIVLGDIEGVLVRPGERTNDPRLSGIDLSHQAALADGPAKPDAAGQPIVLDVRDSSGTPLGDGRILAPGFIRDGDSCWHAGRVLLEPSARGQEIVVWSPGFRAWVGPCPGTSTTLRLERAPRLALHVVIPPAFVRPDCRFRIWPEPAGGSKTALELVGELAPVELDLDGTASFECPAQCTVRFIVQALALESSAGLLREGSVPEPVTTIDLELPSADSSQTISADAEEWAVIERFLGR